MQKKNDKKKLRPPQHQNRQPGLEWKMNPRPAFYDVSAEPGIKLKDKIAIITGGDSGIGRAVAVAFSQQGARIAIIYLNETADAKETAMFILSQSGQECLLIKTDIQKEKNCIGAVRKVIKKFGRVDILVNNAAIHFPQEDIQGISSLQLEKTFRTNVFSMFYLTKAVLPHMDKGSSIINTASVTAYRGSGHLIDYASTKGAIVSFTRSLSASLAEKGIRVNGVAPGPVWTPLIPASFKRNQVASFGSEVPLKRAGETSEIAPCYVFLASEDSSYMTGQFLHPNGGEIING
jgi:NAD(P)-dependent dehydrogenase (short-subunit alcohol dehydrogenase family)